MNRKLYMRRLILWVFIYLIRVFNLHSAIMEYYQTFCLVVLVISGICGLTLNVGFILMNIRHSHLPKAYGYIFPCLSLNYVLAFLSVVFLQSFIILMDIHPKSTLCSIAAIVAIATAINSIFIETIVALNRYISLYFPYKRSCIFSIQNQLVVLSLFSCVSIAMAIGMMFLGYLGRIGNAVCGPDIDSINFFHVSFVTIPVLISKIISIFCVYKIWRIIRNHNEHNCGSRLQETKEIAMLLVVELIVQIFLEFPLLLTCLLNRHIFIPKMLIYVFICLFLAQPIFDPIIIMVIVKPYRKAFLNFFNNYWHVNVNTDSLEVVNLTSKRNTF